MKKNILSLAALLIASAAVFTACSSDDNITSEQPANPTGKYTMTINASKGGDATTRALTLGRNDTDTKNVLNATWDANEVVLVYQNGSQIGTLYSAASTTSATTLTGELDSAPDAGQDLTLYFHTNATPSYAGQDGTLATIASTYDFCAPATITAGNFTVSGNTVSTSSSVSFGANQQSVVKFTLKDKDSEELLNASKVTASLSNTLTGKAGTAYEYIIPASTYTTNGNGVVYLAIENLPAAYVLYKSYIALNITATVGDDTYTYTKTGWPFEDGKYYEITVKMTKQAADPALSLTSPAVGQVIGSDGKNYAYASLPTGVTAVAKICYVSGSNGLALALTDEEGKMNWSTAQTTCAAHTAPFTGGTWKLATKDEWDNMINAAGSYSALRDGFSSVGGTNMKSDNYYYWSSTENGSDFAWYYDFNLEECSNGDKEYNLYVRACLAF